MTVMQVQVQVPVPAPPTPPPAPELPHVVTIGGGSGPDVFETLAIVTVSISMAWLAYKLLSPLIRAFAARIEGKASMALEQRLADLEQRVHEGDQAQQRILELEERLDFAERLLSQRDEPMTLRRQGEGA